MNQIISFKRFFLLARRDFFRVWRNLLIVAGGITGLIFLISIVPAIVPAIVRDVDTVRYGNFFGATLFVWGAIAASQAFSEIHDKNKCDEFFLLPASITEKAIVRLVEVSFGLPILIGIIITFASLITESIRFLAWRLPFEVFNPLKPQYGKYLLYLIIMQSVFFLGATWFKKVHLVKTVLTVVVLGIALGLFGGILSRFILFEYFNEFRIPKDMCVAHTWLFHRSDVYLIAGKIVLYGLLSPFCWVTAWVRLGETQSSDGI